MKIREEERAVTNDEPASPVGRLGITNEKIEPEAISYREEVPLPPYDKTITNYELRITNEKETPKIITNVEVTQKQPEIIRVPEQPKSFVVPKPIIESAPVENNMPKSIIEEKLQGSTVSDHTVSDYSVPKMSSPTSDTGGNSGDPVPKAHDPYHEPIE